MKVSRLAAPLGAVISGIDVKSIDDGAWSEIASLFNEHHVLVFPKQNLLPSDHMVFAERWGRLVKFPYGGLKDFPNIIELKNRGKSGDVNQHWHSDMTYNQAPPLLTMLYAHAAPEFGGDTAFSNQHLAYEDLSSGMKQNFEDVTAFHSAADLARLYGQNAEEAASATHPVFRKHDETGKLALYVCRAFTQNFTGWSKEESRPLLEYLYKHATRMEYQARHHWQAGDLVMWDNRSVLHYAVHDHGDDERIIHRLQVEGKSTL